MIPAKLLEQVTVQRVIRHLCVKNARLLYEDEFVLHDYVLEHAPEGFFTGIKSTDPCADVPSSIPYRSPLHLWTVRDACQTLVRCRRKISVPGQVLRWLSDPTLMLPRVSYNPPRRLECAQHYLLGACDKRYFLHENPVLSNLTYCRMSGIYAESGDCHIQRRQYFYIAFQNHLPPDNGVLIHV